MEHWQYSVYGMYCCSFGHEGILIDILFVDMLCSNVRSLSDNCVVMWKEIIVSLLGIAVLSIAFSTVGPQTLQWILVILGSAITILSLWEAIELADADSHNKSHV